MIWEKLETTFDEVFASKNKANDLSGVTDVTGVTGEKVLVIREASGVPVTPLRKLLDPSAEIAASKWRGEYEERAAFLQYEEGLLPDEAESQALDEVVSGWLATHSDQIVGGSCDSCGAAIADARSVAKAAFMEFGVGPSEKAVGSRQLEPNPFDD